MFRDQMWEDIKKIPILSQIDDFYEGIITSFEEEDFDLGFNYKKAEIALSPGMNGNPLNLVEINLNNSKIDIINILFNEENIEEIYMRIEKPVFINERKVAKIHIRVLDKVIINTDYESGKKMGSEFVKLAKLFNNGLHKEVFESMLLFFVARKVKKIDIDVFQKKERIELSVSTNEKNDLFYYPSENIENLQYIDGLVSGKNVKLEINPITLEKLRLGRIRS